MVDIVVMVARQQREEIARKKEMNDMMRNKKRDGLRPESPGSRRRRMTRRLPVGARGQRLAGRTEVRACTHAQKKNWKHTSG